MKTNLRRLALAALLLSSPTTLLAADGSSVVGDLPGLGEEAYFGENAAYGQPQPAPADTQAFVQAVEAVSHDAFVGDIEEPIGSSVVAPSAVAAPQFAPLPVQTLQPVSHRKASSVSCDAGCDGGCDGKCSSKKRRKVLSGLDKDLSNTWASFEGLLWFTQDRDSAPLIVSSDAGTLPILPDNNGPNPDNVQTVFGDDLNGEITGGFRIDGGTWITDNIGIGGRFWILHEFNNSFAFDDNGDNFSLGRSFFNSDLPGEDSFPIALTGAAVGPDLAGSIIADNSLELFAAEGYARIRFAGTKNTQLDFIGGYSHFEIDDTLNIASSTTILGTGGPPPIGSAVGDTTSFVDSFSTENEFNGGQLGFEFTMTQGKWFAKSLTKVHLGNNNQRVQISGSSTLDVIGGGTTVNAGGILAGSTPIDVERNVFSFVPEANFKLGYRFRPNVLLSVGYSFIYFDNVALTGDTIDRIVDGSTLGSGANLNGFNADEDSSLWVQGIDLGFVIDF